MKYMLLIYRHEADFDPSVTSGAHSAPYITYAQAMAAAGIMVEGNRLQPSTTASTVRLVDGKAKVLDGPYSETKEQLGGYYVIDVPDLDAALEWAARCPGANQGTMEVRPVWTM
jgi:hypothetical protein